MKHWWLSCLLIWILILILIFLSMVHEYAYFVCIHLENGLLHDNLLSSIIVSQYHPILLSVYSSLYPNHDKQHISSVSRRKVNLSHSQCHPYKNFKKSILWSNYQNRCAAMVLCKISQHKGNRLGIIWVRIRSLINGFCPILITWSFVVITWSQLIKQIDSLYKCNCELNVKVVGLALVSLVVMKLSV